MGKILIIDDERAIRRALREILEFEEFEVAEAENGKQGFDMAKTEEYDIIFCDKNTHHRCSTLIFTILPWRNSLHIII